MRLATSPSPTFLLEEVSGNSSVTRRGGGRVKENTFNLGNGAFISRGNLALLHHKGH